MDTIRLFLRSNSLRLSKRKTNTSPKFSPTEFTQDEPNDSLDNEDNQSSSSDKIKSLVTNSASSSGLSKLPMFSLDSETWSGLSTHSSDHAKSSIIAASASDSMSNALSFTNSHSSKRRRSSHGNDIRHRSWINEQNMHTISSLSSPPFRRTKSHRPSERIRRHSIKLKHSQMHSEPFQTTYRQRNEEFRKLFKDVPDSERLIVDYSCAWQKDILVQGRVYLSQNYICFYANILNWKSHLCLKFDDINGITREKTAKVISNAIEIKTNKGEKYFFASFVTRDKTYAIMHRIWQAVSDSQPLSTQQLWTMIHESYGDDLDMTTDEDDNYHKSTLNSPSDKPSSKSPSQSLDKYDLSNIVLRLNPSSIFPNSFPQEDDQSSVSSRGEHASDDEGIIPIGEEARTSTLMRRPQSNSIELSIDSTPEVCYLTQCACQTHLATQIINRTYPMSVEHLFDCIFGDNNFLVAYRASRRIKDFQASEWKMNDETGKRERLCTFKVTVSAVFGSTTICSNERQIIDCEQSKSHYILDTEVRNEGIKYADSFFVASRYCLIQIGPNKSHLKVTCEVRYVKSLMAIIKTFIEKNAMAALQDSFTDLMKRIDQESSTKTRALSISNNNETQNVTESPSLPVRRLPRQQHQANELLSSVNDLSINSQEDNEEEESIRQDQKSLDSTVTNSFLSSRNSFFIPFCFITMLLLLIVNIFLCIKLNQIDQMTDRLVRNYPSWLNQYSHRHEDNQWPSLLKKQEEYYQMQLNHLHSVLTATHHALKNMGRKYYCDYCDRRIPPGLTHRKNHNRTIQHINNKRTYYFQFKDLTEILLEERSKRICNKWNQTGSCPFGENCKYSHRSNYKLIQLIEQAQQNSTNPSNFDVQRWIGKKLPNGIHLPESLAS
ncbi:hypothetical protein I4U23_011906 [Adineta vaga]|nr:hypothetical protein I4U23_011906 [Adineta vaga]